MKMKVFLFALLLSNACHAERKIEECDFSQFPDFWAEAEERVESLTTMLKTLEKKSGYAVKTSGAFKQSLKLCEDKRKVVFNDPATNGGAIAQSKCEAFLICSRIMMITTEM